MVQSDDVEIVDLVVKVTDVPTIGLYFFFFMRPKNEMLKLHVGEANMSAWTRLFQWLPPGAIHARLQGGTHVRTSINQAAAAPGS